MRNRKRNPFTMMELLVMKIYKRSIFFSANGRAGCNLPLPSFFLPLFKCFSIPSYFRLPCSIVQLFSCSIVQLFSCSCFQGENKNFHPHRAPHRDCDHRDFSCDAAACTGQGAGKGKRDILCRKSETAFHAYCQLSQFQKDWLFPVNNSLSHVPSPS